MFLGRVIGSVTATIKNPSLEGIKLLVVQPITKEGKDKGKPVVAVDSVGAGFKEVVYWCRGREASLAWKDREVPTECTIVGIVDHIETPAKNLKFG